MKRNNFSIADLITPPENTQLASGARQNSAIKDISQQIAANFSQKLSVDTSAGFSQKSPEDVCCKSGSSTHCNDSTQFGNSGDKQEGVSSMASFAETVLKMAAQSDLRHSLLTSDSTSEKESHSRKSSLDDETDDTSNSGL